MSHFIKIGADGAQLPVDAKEHVAVLDMRTGLMWTAHRISDQWLNFEEAKAAAGELSLAGFQNWRLPEVEELFLLCDRKRFEPAIDTDFFPGIEPTRFWTGTVDAEAPSSYAWYVYLHGGDAFIHDQYSSGRVLACRAVSQ